MNTAEKCPSELETFSFRRKAEASKKDTGLEKLGRGIADAATLVEQAKTTAETLETFFDSMDNDETEVRESLLEALGSIDDPEIVAAFEARFKQLKTDEFVKMLDAPADTIRDFIRTRLLPLSGIDKHGANIYDVLATPEEREAEMQALLAEARELYPDDPEKMLEHTRPAFLRGRIYENGDPVTDNENDLATRLAAIDILDTCIERARLRKELAKGALPGEWIPVPNETDVVLDFGEVTQPDTLRLPHQPTESWAYNGGLLAYTDAKGNTYVGKSNDTNRATLNKAQAPEDHNLFVPFSTNDMPADPELRQQIEALKNS